MKTLTVKLLESHLIDGEMIKGEEIGIKIDHTLIQDSTGTLADLQFEAMKLPSVKTELSLSFADHNTLQNDHRNADDHKYLASIASKYGLIFSKPGNGICHQVFLERFAAPGKTLLGSDSHTTTAGGVGSLSIGAGGLDVAVAMAGEPYYLEVPSVIGVELSGCLQDFVSAKDVILEVLRRIGVKGAVGKVLEYHGSGVKGLSVPERGTITNMGTETGATSSIFPSDETTKKFLKSQGRPEAWTELSADSGVEYDEYIHIDLDDLEPLIALPHSPGNVKTVKEVEGMKLDQVCVGSCTNSSLKDLQTVAQLLKNQKIDSNVSFTVSPGSRQVLTHLTETGELSYLIGAGARILECTCGPCIGMGQAPPTDGVSLRTFNRNFKGRSGTPSAQVYLCSPETATASAINGVITDPRTIGDYPRIEAPEKFIINDNLLLKPSKTPENVQILRGLNIKPLPEFKSLDSEYVGEVLLKLGDNVTTDDIMPAGAKLLPLRSNIPEISKHVFEQVDFGFYSKATEKGGGFIVGGENYGQGSSREHAAIAPKYLGVKAVIVKSFARIHKSNLVNFGIIPLKFKDKTDYNRIEQGDKIQLDISDRENVKLRNITRRHEYSLELNLNLRGYDILMKGGKLAQIREIEEQR